MHIFRPFGGSVSSRPEGLQGDTHFYRDNLRDIAILATTVFILMHMCALAPKPTPLVEKEAGRAERIVEKKGGGIKHPAWQQRKSFFTPQMKNDYQLWRLAEHRRPAPFQTILLANQPRLHIRNS